MVWVCAAVGTLVRRTRSETVAMAPRTTIFTPSNPCDDLRTKQASQLALPYRSVRHPYHFKLEKARVNGRLISIHLHRWEVLLFFSEKPAPSLCTKDPKFYTPLALNCQKGQHLPALEVYKNKSLSKTSRGFKKLSGFSDPSRSQERSPTNTCFAWLWCNQKGLLNSQYLGL